MALTIEQMQTEARDFADRATELLQRHEHEVHGGKVCWANRISFVAYLAHCLGVRHHAQEQIGDAIAEYELRCPDCPHVLKN